MSVVIGAHRFDLTERAVVAGLAHDPAQVMDAVAAGADVVAVPQELWSEALHAAVCDRVDVPVVACTLDADLATARLLPPGGAPVDGFCPVGDRSPVDALAEVVAGVLGGAQVVVAADVRMVRRVVEVVARLREARRSR